MAEHAEWLRFEFSGRELTPERIGARKAVMNGETLAERLESLCHWSRGADMGESVCLPMGDRWGSTFTVVKLHPQLLGYGMHAYCRDTSEWKVGGMGTLLDAARRWAGALRRQARELSAVTAEA
jgi:hypothetical protein